jgi:hypothetical protein
LLIAPLLVIKSKELPSSTNKDKEPPKKNPIKSPTTKNSKKKSLGNGQTSLHSWFSKAQKKVQDDEVMVLDGLLL